jgi:hypothetical protein
MELGLKLSHCLSRWEAALDRGGVYTELRLFVAFALDTRRPAITPNLTASTFYTRVPGGCPPGCLLCLRGGGGLEGVEHGSASTFSLPVRAVLAPRLLVFMVGQEGERWAMVPCDETKRHLADDLGQCGVGENAASTLARAG